MAASLLPALFRTKAFEVRDYTRDGDEICYRYEVEEKRYVTVDEWDYASVFSEGYYVILIQMKVLRHTPRGFWFQRFGQYATEDKFVCHDWNKKGAHLTKAEALESAIMRKRRNLLFAERRLAEAKAAAEVLQSFKEKQQ